MLKSEILKPNNLSYIRLFFLYASVNLLTLCNTKSDNVINYESLQLTSQCEEIFIGRVFQFNDSDEFYLNISFKDQLDYESSVRTIKSNLDLLVFEGEGILRKRIKKDFVEEYFNHRGLDTIYFYDRNNELIGSGVFVRAEYVDYFVEDEQFISVYKPLIPFSNKPYYASNCKINIKKTELVSVKNDSLENKIIETFKIDRNSIIETTHFVYSKDKANYSVISYDFPYLNSILVKHKEGKIIKIYETEGNHIVDDFLISAFEINNKPILIVSFKKPDSGYYFETPLFYDGEAYKFKSDNWSGVENTKGDYNGDGVYEYVYMENPEFPIVVAPIEEEGIQDCVDSCDCYLKFSNNNIPSIKIENCIGGIPENLGDLNNDGIDEVGILPQWWTSCWMNYKVYTFKNGKWKYLIEPITTHCNSWTKDFKIIEKDPNIEDNVIIRYTEMSRDLGIVTKVKSIKVN